ncbi:hypothetical protein PV04_10559 [Phialophora macrospora]|uniref:DNA repair protein Rad26 n=1 Tax=Phialophora macrospora TaxID=1851006 RepID=A0A0D2FQU2_9EURO|nr:hypothetical protein PV04_10559 [Phialophora macrospora]
MSGMDDNEDETDLFDDDGFDSLSETALQELEHNAILSTQAQVQNSGPQPPPVQSPPRPVPQARTAAAQALPNARPLNSNPALHRYLTEEDDSFELIGDESVPTPVEEHDSFSFRRAQFRQQRHGRDHNDVLHRPIVQKNHQRHAGSFQPNHGDETLQNTPARPDELMVDAPLQQSEHARQEDERENIQYRLEKLQHERDKLAQELRVAEDAVSLQKGEILIIRAKLEEESKGHNRQIGTLKKSMEEQLAKYTAQLHALTEKNNNLTTQYNFLQQEHNQEVQESKTLRQRLKDKPRAEREASPTTTPRRGMARSLRDGFNDDDIMLISPSKSDRRPKPPTPTAANKRKRKAAEPSPIKPLPLRLSNQNQDDMPPPPLQRVQTVEPVAPVARKDKHAERHLKFLQSILKYKLIDTKEPLFEALAKFTFPSCSSKTFSAILLESTAQLTGSRLPGDVLQLFVDLWSKCMKEQYYRPISLLLEIVNHIVDLEMFILDADIITSLSPVLQSSITINAKNRFEHSPVYHATYGKFRQTPQSILNRDVNGTECLDLMLTIAYTVADDPGLLSLFWRQMNPEFVLMMLNVWQPIADITLMLRLLSTSILPSTFGSICNDNQQTQVEHWTLSRICYLLWETPRVDEGLPPNTTAQLCLLRLEVMNLLTRLAINSSPPPHDDPSHHGSLLLATDAHAIGRLVRSLYDEVSAMYTLHPTTHHLHAELINKGVSLLHHILQLHGSSINLQEKLSAINGGVHKHRVVLTRLAFSEGFVIDRLISDETVAMATQMLEESVTPDEADDLVECFPGFKGRGSPTEDN